MLSRFSLQCSLQYFPYGLPLVTVQAQDGCAHLVVSFAIAHPRADSTTGRGRLQATLIPSPRMLRTLHLAIWLLVLCPLAALAQTPAPAVQPEPPYDRFHEFIHNTIKSPAFHVEAFGAALIDQTGHFPKEWDSEDNAFLKRNAARFGQAFV